MRRAIRILTGTALAVLSAIVAPQVGADTIDERLAAYQAEGAANFSAERGKEMWFREFTASEDGKGRRCTSCHGDNARVSGKHAKTGKPIEPMAPSINPERFGDAAKIEKWFKRNCKWTLERECTAQEKGDFLSYLRQL
ncbi:MAG: DUF1924 domain-containing protein [Gammaproteobacteria bacterium]|nr:DUF1924 domain-containing protein [Gammaproteobacteria bacterium]